MCLKTSPCEQLSTEKEKQLTPIENGTVCTEVSIFASTPNMYFTFLEKWLVKRLEWKFSETAGFLN